MPDFVIYSLITATLFCVVLNVCWWLYGGTLSEILPAPLVLTTMLITLSGFFKAFDLLFVEICNNIISPGWEYVIEFDEYVAPADEIARVLAGVLTVGIAILLYKDEGKYTVMSNSNERE